LSGEYEPEKIDFTFAEKLSFLGDYMKEVSPSARVPIEAILGSGYNEPLLQARFVEP